MTVLCFTNVISIKGVSREKHGTENEGEQRQNTRKTLSETKRGEKQ